MSSNKLVLSFNLKISTQKAERLFKPTQSFRFFTHSRRPRRFHKPFPNLISSSFSIQMRRISPPVKRCSPEDSGNFQPLLRWSRAYRRTQLWMWGELRRSLRSPEENKILKVCQFILFGILPSSVWLFEFFNSKRAVSQEMTLSMQQ